MYSLPTTNYQQRSFFMNGRRVLPKAAPAPVTHQERVLDDLRRLGLSKVALRSPEARYLPEIIHQDEQIGGVVYGYHQDGFAMIVATDCRTIFLNKRPMFLNEDEIAYEVVAGVNYSHAGLGTTVILHSRIKDYAIRTLNQQSARTFVRYIESRCLENTEA